MTRSGDWNARNRQLLEETKRIGAPYYQRYQELKRKRMKPTLNELIEPIIERFYKANEEMGWTSEIEAVDIAEALRDNLRSIAIAAMDAVRPETQNTEQTIEASVIWAKGYNEATNDFDRRRAAFLGANKE